MGRGGRDEWLARRTRDTEVEVVGSMLVDRSSQCRG